MGFLKRLFKRQSKTEVTAKVAVPAETAPAKQAVPKATPAPAAKAAAKAPVKADKDYRPQCGALTAAGGQCKNSARAGSKYCGSHKGYQPPSAAKAAAAADTEPAVGKATDTAPAARKAPAKKAADKKLQPQCAALTAAGGQCKNSARDGSKYCGSHKGYRPPAKAVAKKADDTAPKVAAAKDTKPAARRTQVTKYGYKLYQNGNRYFFSKKAQKDVKGTAVYTMPKDRSVVRTPNGLPVLKKKE